VLGLRAVGRLGDRAQVLRAGGVEFAHSGQDEQTDRTIEVSNLTQHCCCFAPREMLVLCSARCVAKIESPENAFHPAF
jgi:hypothetical protein